MSQAEFKRRLKALMLRPENQVCSDCPERQPRWASLIVPPPGAPPGSLPMGAFCCLECSGSHRRLGVHISFVRSVNLDQWKEKEVLAMENGGNEKVNALFEARLSVAKPSNTASGPVRERFIRDKYERRKFYDASAFARFAEMNDASNTGSGNNDRKTVEQDKVVAGVQRRLASDRGSSGVNHSATIRKPSDAARKRVEERAARNRTAGGAAPAPIRNKPVKAPVPKSAPAPAPVADLLDFGDFDSPEATSAVAAASTHTQSTGSNSEPALDLFANMSIGNVNGGAVVQTPTSEGQSQIPTEQQQGQGAENKKMTSDQILAMFNTPNPNQSNMQQNNMFAMGGGGMTTGGGGNMMMNNGMGMMSNNNMAMMNNNNMGMMNNNNMGMMNSSNMMANSGNYMGNNMMGNVNGAAASYGGMGGNTNMPMMGGGGMSSQYGAAMGGNSNPNYNNTNMMMMQQQSQMQQMNNMMGSNASMMGGNTNMMMMQGTGHMQGGNQLSTPMGQPQVQSQTTGVKPRGGTHVDQFADFGNFGR